MKKEKIKIEKIFLLVIMFILSCSLVLGLEADFVVDSFSCTPTEVVINDAFSCTAQVKNNGEIEGSVSVATLYPDASDWLEDSNYPQASGTSVDPGQSVEIVFTGLRAVKSGDNGFSKIMLDVDTDNYVSDNEVKVNVIDVLVTSSSSASSAAMGVGFDVTAEVTVGGNVDVTLVFTVDSGGCSIGNQASSKTISGLQDGNKQSRSWTSVTQGTSGDCQYTITALATGTAGAVSKSDSSQNSVDCTDCPTDSGDSSSSSGGTSGGGGGGGGKIYYIDNFVSAQIVELAKNERVKFNISDVEHTLTLTNLSETHATISVKSEKQTFILGLEQEVKIDLSDNGVADISVKLRSINTVTNKAKLILTPVSGGVPDVGIEKEEAEDEETRKKREEMEKEKRFWFWLVIIVILAILAVGSAYYFIKRRRKIK